MAEDLIGAAVSLIALILIAQALFPGLLAKIAETTIFALVGVLVFLLIGGMIWLGIKYFGNGETIL